MLSLPAVILPRLRLLTPMSLAAPAERNLIGGVNMYTHTFTVYIYIYIYIYIYEENMRAPADELQPVPDPFSTPLIMESA